MHTGASARGAADVARGAARLKHLFVDGRFVAGSGEPLATVDPATEAVLATVSTASTSDVDSAVRAARRGYDRFWSRMPGTQRAGYLFRIARLVQECARELAVLESLDTGTPIRQSRDVDVPAAAAQFSHHAGWADKLSYAGYGPDPKPIGVTGAVLPWRCPLLLAACAIAPALACGNTVVLKPAGSAPLAALALAEILQQVDLPPGVVNVLPGDGSVGAGLVAHPGLDGVSVAGSAAVGAAVQRALTGTTRRLTLHLDGPVVTIVFADAPLDGAVEAALAAVLAGRGAGSRLLVAELIAKELGARLRARIGTLRVGDPLDEDTDIGPMHSRRRLERTIELTGGAERRTDPAPLPDRGFFLAPTVIADTGRPQMPGPVLSVRTFSTPHEAVAEADGALAAGIWSAQGSLVRWAARRVRADVVWAGTAPRSDPAAPFTGYRRPGPGRAALAAYLRATDDGSGR